MCIYKNVSTANGPMICKNGDSTNIFVYILVLVLRFQAKNTDMY